MALACSLWLSVCVLALSGFSLVLTQKPQEKPVFKNLRKSSLAFILCFSLALFDVALSCFDQKPQEKTPIQKPEEKYSCQVYGKRFVKDPCLWTFFLSRFLKTSGKNPCFKNLRKIRGRCLAALVVFFLWFVCPLVNEASLLVWEIVL